MRATRARGAIASLAAVILAAAGAGCGGSSPTTRPPDPAAAAGPAATAAPVIGVAEPNAWRRSPAPATARRIAAKVTSLGAESQRFVVDWSIAEPAPPGPEHRYRFEAFDQMYRADVARGIRPLLVVMNAPVWAADPGAPRGSSANNPPAASQLGDWAEFVGEVARRYPRVAGIEIWNEPNLAEFWGDGSALVRPDPNRYAVLLEAGYDAVKSARPRTRVIGGALSSTATTTPAGDVAAADFLRAVLTAGGAGHMDGLSLHPYPGEGEAERTLELIDRVRAVRDEAGATTSLWLTEVGVTTAGPAAASEAEQAATLVEICREATSQPDIGAIYFHNLIEQPGPGIETGFGLLRPLPDGSLRRKPAYTALRRELRAARACAGA